MNFSYEKENIKDSKSLFPFPRELQWKEGMYTVNSRTKIFVAVNEYKRAAELLQEQIKDRFDIELPIEAHGAGIPKDGILIGASLEALKPEGYTLSVTEDVIGIFGIDKSGAIFGTQTLLQLGVKDKRGQLKFPAAEIRDWPYKPIRGFHVYMPGNNSIEGFKRIIKMLVHVKMNMLIIEVGGGMEYDRHPEINQAWKKFCREVMSYPGGPEEVHRTNPYMLNSMHPELGGGAYLSKEEVRNIVEYARDLGFTVVPEIQSLSHSYYLTMAHREIAERPLSPYPDSYCPSNPRSYELYFDIAEEVLEVFKPEWVSIGHDELWTLGECPLCKDKTGEELVASDIAKLYDFYKTRDIRVMQWCQCVHNFMAYDGSQAGGLFMEYKVTEGNAWDATEANKFENTEGRYWRILETYKAAGMIPKDILMLDECHGSGSESEMDLKKNGFMHIYGNFNIRGKMIADWEVRSARENVLGAQVSTWCYADEYTMGRNNVIYGLMFASDQLWWDGYNDKLWESERLRIIEHMPAIRKILKGIDDPLISFDKTSFDIFYAGNCSGEQALSLSPGNVRWVKGSKLPLVFGNVSRLSGIPVDTGNIYVNIDTKVKSLIFLHAAIKPMEFIPTWNFNDMSAYLLAKYEIVFADGSIDELEVRFGIETGNMNMDWGRYRKENDYTPQEINKDAGLTEERSRMKAPYYFAFEPWEGSLFYSLIPVCVDTDNGTKTLFAFEWINPDPSREISTVRAVNTCKEPDQKLLIFAIAGAK